jgi:uncharacterized double-CXXCG motif protein
MKFYWLHEVRAPRYSGSYNAGHRWMLPGAHCPVCDAIWSACAESYPSVDLTQLPDRDKYSPRLEEDYAEFERLREQVRPLVPPGAQLEPGSRFGPIEGTAQGEFGPLLLQNPWELLIRREVLEPLQAAGVRGLKGCRTELRFRRKNPPEILELELLPRGRLHPDCLPPDRPTPCAKCGRRGWRLPEQPMLEASSLPEDLDVFRVGDFATVLVGTERFVEAVRHLGYEQDILFREMPVR